MTEEVMTGVPNPASMPAPTCPNPAIDAVRSVFSAVGKDVSCDKAKGYVILAVGIIALLLILKYFVLKR